MPGVQVVHKVLSNNKSWTLLEIKHDCEEGIILKLDVNNSTPIIIATLYLLVQPRPKIVEPVRVNFSRT